MKQTLLMLTLLATGGITHATLYSTNWNTGFANGGVVPDNNSSGWADTRTVNAAPAGTIANLAVNLTLTGGWNGDLYAYLVSGSGFSVLLDRIGGGPYGDGNAGMNVTLTTAATLFGANQGNIGSYAGVGNPVGTWTPDITSGSWGSFAGLAANNSTWTLFVADLSGRSVSTVSSWGLQMDIVAVPEVETWVAAALAGAFGAFWLNRQIRKGVRQS